MQLFPAMFTYWLRLLLSVWLFSTCASAVFEMGHESLEPETVMGVLKKINLDAIKYKKESEGGPYHPKFGTRVGSFVSHLPGISGQVYVVDDRHLYVVRFNFKSHGPACYFWVGRGRQPSPRGRLVPYPTEEYTFHTHFDSPSPFGKLNASRPLSQMEDVDVLLSLPEGLTVSQLDWLAVWAPRFTLNYADIRLDTSKLRIPSKETLDAFPEDRQRQLRSGRIQVLDTRTLLIPRLSVRIVDSGYFFYVANLEKGVRHRLANEEGRFDQPIKAYDEEDLMLSLPKDVDIFNINAIQMYNPEVRHALASVKFNLTGKRVPPAVGQTKKPGWWFNHIPVKPINVDHRDRDVPFNHDLELPNCRELLGRKLRLLWTKNNGGSHVYFRVQVHLSKPTEQFVAIGIAARNGSPKIEADIVKIYFNQTANRFVTEDAFLAKQILCDFNYGLCTDTSYSSSDNIRYMGSLKSAGISVIDFRKSILPTDLHDAPISMDGPTQVLVAIGSSSSLRLSSAFSKTSGDYRRGSSLEIENTTVDFSSDKVDDSCPDISSHSNEDEKTSENGWVPSVIVDQELFVAVLGPPAGAKGFGAITGNPPLDLSVVWYINGKLMPEIYVERGKSYFFRVQGGDDPGNSLHTYHPLYITDNSEGGYGRKGRMERRSETIFAGVDNVAGQDRATGAGPLCEYVADAPEAQSEADTYESFFESLRLACEPGRSDEYGWVNFTVPNDTGPVLYYQSYNGFNLGWKIHVVNEGEQLGMSGTEINSPSLTMIISLILIRSIVALCLSKKVVIQ